MVKASDLGAEGPRFKPWQQHLVQLSLPSERWRGGHGNRVGAKLNVEAQVVKAEKYDFCWSLRNPRRQGTCTSLLNRSDGTINRGLFWPHMHSIWHGIKRSWHSIEGGSVIVGVESVSHIQTTSMHRINEDD